MVVSTPDVCGSRHGIDLGPTARHTDVVARWHPVLSSAGGRRQPVPVCRNRCGVVGVGGGGEENPRGVTFKHAQTLTPVTIQDRVPLKVFNGKARGGGM